MRHLMPALRGPQYNADFWTMFWANITKGLVPPPGTDPSDWYHPTALGALAVELARHIEDQQLAAGLRNYGNSLLQNQSAIGRA